MVKPESNDTRERLIAAAMQLFQQQGYGATGVAQILKAADAKSGSLYYFFPTKEDLLLAVLEKYRQMLWPVLLDPIFSRISDPIERIFGLLDGYRQFILASDFTYGCPIGNLALELAHTHPNVRRLIERNFQGWRDAVQKCLDEAGDRFPPEVNRAELALFVLTVMEGGVMQARTYRKLEPFDSAVTQLRDYLDRLLADGTTWSTGGRAGRARDAGRN
jgi:TetR/AcrR family transcriptional repressor of nem operon